MLKSLYFQPIVLKESGKRDPGRRSRNKTLSPWKQFLPLVQQSHSEVSAQQGFCMHGVTKSSDVQQKLLSIIDYAHVEK